MKTLSKMRIYRSVVKDAPNCRKRMSLYKWVLLIVCISLNTSNLFAQEKTESRVPDYPVPYTYPSVDSIKGVLNRVRNYYDSTCDLKIIDSKTGKEITDFTTPNKNARVSEGFAGEWSYTNGVVLSAFEYIDDVTGDSTYFADNTRFFNLVVKTLPYFEKNHEVFGKEARGGWGRTPNFKALDDCGSIGAAMIKTYLKNKNKDYLPLIDTIADYISNRQFRLKDGTLARHRPQYVSVWADDLYMSVPFLVNMGKLTGDHKYYDDAVRQILQMAQRLYVPSVGLFDHGWNKNSGEYDPRFYWGRANGWAILSMSEVLSVLPENYPGRNKVLDLFRSMVRTLAHLQDGTGFWHNLLDKNDTYLETSCTAIFTYCIAKGINEGWISHVYGPVAIMGWNAVNTRVLKNGAVDGTCEGTTFASDNTYYYYRGRSIYATHGYGPVLYAGAEMIRLLENDKFIIVKPKPNSINSAFHFLLKSEWPEK